MLKDLIAKRREVSEQMDSLLSEYQTKNRGQVFKNRSLYLIQKAQRLDILLREYGKGTVTTYSIKTKGKEGETQEYVVTVDSKLNNTDVILLLQIEQLDSGIEEVISIRPTKVQQLGCFVKKDPQLK